MLSLSIQTKVCNSQWFYDSIMLRTSHEEEGNKASSDSRPVEKQQQEVNRRRASLEQMVEDSIQVAKQQQSPTVLYKKGDDLSHHQQRNLEQNRLTPNQLLEQQIDINRPKRNPFCSRCRNHGKSAQVKGHKRHCEYRDCQCDGCKLVECRQIVSAAQIKRRRYQKQDEECGRRIEVSPPVLIRKTSDDPATLIAKTLIRTSRHASSVSPAIQNSPTTGPPLIHVSSAVAAAAAAAAATTNPMTGHKHQLYTRLHQPLNSPVERDQIVSLAPSVPTVDQSNLSGNTNHQLHLQNVYNHHYEQHHHHNPHLGFKFNSEHHNGSRDPIAPAPALATSTSSSLNNPFEMFHFPNSLLSAAAAAKLAKNSAVAAASSVALSQTRPAASQASSSLSTTTTATMPSVSSTTAVAGNNSASSSSVVNEQLKIVEEIHQAFGPQAIYAWLKAEQFDIQRVRNLIEISSASYHSLIMDSKSKYSIDNRDQLTASNSESNSRSSSIASLLNVGRKQNGGKHQSQDLDQKSEKRPQSQHLEMSSESVRAQVGDCHRIASSINGSIASSPVYPNYMSAVSDSFSAKCHNHSALPPVTTASTAVLANGHHEAHREMAALASSASSSSSSAAAAAAAAAAALGHNLSGVNARSILWPSSDGIKLNGAIPSSTLIHPHLLPYFMHHHHTFLSQQTQQHQLSAFNSSFAAGRGPAAAAAASSSAAMLQTNR